MKRWWSVLGLVLTLVVGGCGAAATPTTTPTAVPAKPTAAAPTAPIRPAGTPAGAAAGTPAASTAKTAAKQYAAPPPMTIDPAKKYTAVITTTKGPITIELLANEAPMTVNNFVFLANEGFYNGTIFHRVIRGFMIQGGAPSGTGSGTPGYRFKDEPVTRDYKRGIVAMANAGPNTNGSQFFIMHADRPLPKQYTIFGQVTSGMETVDAIASAPTAPGGEASKPVEPVQITGVEIKVG